MGYFPRHTLIEWKRGGFKLFPLFVLSSLLCGPIRAAEPESSEGRKRITRTSKLTKTTEGTTFSLQIDLEREDIQSGPALGRTILRVEDAASRTPLSGLHPLIWMFQAESTQDIKQDACVGRIKTAMKGLLSAQADVDLNNFMLLTLNDDHTISVINPQIAFSKTKLHSLISLPGPAADWILAQDAHKIFISIPEKKEIAVVSAEQFKLLARIPVKGKPWRMALSPEQDKLWITHEGEDGVEILDTKTNRVAGNIPHGRGHKALVFTNKDRLVWVSDTASQALLVVNPLSFEVETKIAVGAGGQSLTTSEQAGLVFVSHSEMGSISVIDSKRREKIKDIKLAKGVAEIRVDPSGRWLFAVNPIQGHLDVIDTADLSLRYHREGLDKPDAVSFSRAFAYIRNGHSEKIQLLDLSLLKGNSSITMVGVPIGQSTPGSRADLGMASPFAPTPDGKSMFIAHPSDRSLYFYAEGMMATSGTHLNYGRKPRAVLLVDRSLREIEPGVYAGHFTVDTPSIFDIALVVENPRVATCWKWEVPSELFPGMTRSQSMPEIVTRFNPRKTLKAGVGSTLKFHVKDHKTGRVIDDQNIQVLILKAPVGGQWQPQVRYQGKGNFEIDFTPPQAGEYRLLVAMPDQGKGFGSIPDVTLGVKASKKAVQAIPEASR